MTSLQNKTIKVCTQLRVTGSSGKIISEIPEFEDVSIKTFVNLSTKIVEEFYVKCNPGEAVVTSESSKDFYFDINKDGELIIIYPSDYDFEINNLGELSIIFLN